MPSRSPISASSADSACARSRIWAARTSSCVSASLASRSARLELVLALRQPAQLGRRLLADRLVGRQLLLERELALARRGERPLERRQQPLRARQQRLSRSSCAARRRRRSRRSARSRSSRSASRRSAAISPLSSARRASSGPPPRLAPLLDQPRRAALGLERLRVLAAQVPQLGLDRLAAALRLLAGAAAASIAASAAARARARLLRAPPRSSSARLRSASARSAAPCRAGGAPRASAPS